MFGGYFEMHLIKDLALCNLVVRQAFIPTEAITCLRCWLSLRLKQKTCETQFEMFQSNRQSWQKSRFDRKASCFLPHQDVTPWMEECQRLFVENICVYLRCLSNGKAINNCLPRDLLKVFQRCDFSSGVNEGGLLFVIAATC